MKAIGAGLTCAMLLWGLLAGALAAAELRPGESRLRDRWGGLEVSLALSAPVAYRIHAMADPMRLILDFRDLDIARIGQATGFDRARRVTDLAAGPVRPGWSRMVLMLDRPLVLEQAGLEIDGNGGGARLVASFADSDPQDFAAAAGAPPPAPWMASGPARRLPPPAPDGPLRVLIDPGHGGIDPGAERQGVAEKALMLQLAREMRAALQALGAEVYLTREDDRFVSLEGRVAMAHELQADVFVSLHADALAQGRASGTTVHTLSESATDAASAKLAERHDRDDILAGVDLGRSDDVVAGVLMDLARTETQPRSRALAATIVAGLDEAGLPLNSRPLRSAGYSVLKAADIPSVLVETGFLSSPEDLANLIDPAFRSRFAGALAGAIVAWQAEDALRRHLLRQ